MASAHARGKKDRARPRPAGEVAAFQAPQHVAVEELRIETWLPFDEATKASCVRLTARSDQSQL